MREYISFAGDAWCLFRIDNENIVTTIVKMAAIRSDTDMTEQYHVVRNLKKLGE